MTTFLTAACLTLAAIAFAVGAHTLFSTIATLSLMFDYLDERLTAMEDEWEPDDTDLDDEDDDSDDDLSDDETPLYDPNARMTFKPRDPDKWKYQ